MTKLKKRLTFIIVSLGILTGLSLFHASSVLAVDVAVPMSVRRCEPSRVFDRNGFLIYDSSARLNRLGSAYPLFLSEVTKSFTTDLACSGLTLSTSFDLSLQQELGKALLSELSKQPTTTYTVVVCDPRSRELVSVVSLGESIPTLSSNASFAQLEVNGIKTSLSPSDLIKNSCGDTSFIRSISQGQKLLFQKEASLPGAEQVKNHTLIAKQNAKAEVYLSLSSSPYVAVIFINDDSNSLSTETNQDILRIIDQTLDTAHKTEGGDKNAKTKTN